MGYKLSSESLDQLLGSFCGNIAAWRNEIEAVVCAEQTIGSSVNIRGKSANNLKEYFSTMYPIVTSSLAQVLALFQNNLAIFVNDFQSQVGSSQSTIVIEEELNEIRAHMDASRTNARTIGRKAELAVADIHHLVRLPSLDVISSDVARGDILEQLDDLNNKIIELDAKHLASDFPALDEAIASLDSFLQELIAKKRSYKTSFSNTNSLIGFKSASRLFMANAACAAVLSSTADEAALARERFIDRLEARQAAREKREREAAWAKIGVGIVIGVASVFLAPAAPLLVGVVLGAAKLAFDAAADEYVDNGWDTGSWDTSKIAVNACVGGFCGLATGFVPQTAGVFVKAGVKGISGAIEGAAFEAYDQAVATGSITDTSSVIFEGLEKGAGDFVGSVVGESFKAVASDKVGQIPFVKNALDTSPGDLEPYGTTIIKGGISGAASGVGSRFATTLFSQGGEAVDALHHGESFTSAVDKLDPLEALKDSVSPRKLVGDIVGGMAKGPASEYVRRNPVD